MYKTQDLSALTEVPSCSSHSLIRKKFQPSPHSLKLQLAKLTGIQVFFTVNQETDTNSIKKFTWRSFKNSSRLKNILGKSWSNFTFQNYCLFPDFVKLQINFVIIKIKLFVYNLFIFQYFSTNNIKLYLLVFLEVFISMNFTIYWFIIWQINNFMSGKGERTPSKRILLKPISYIQQLTPKFFDFKI